MPTVHEDDCRDAVAQHSSALVDDFGFEMRDVSGLSADLLYSLIGCDQRNTRDYYQKLLSAGGLDAAQSSRAIELMLWYGLLGVVGRDDQDRFIYDYNYNARRLHAEIARDDPATLVVNPALHVGLSS
jgi:hypothetical protein